jgi:spore maturation protein CgeB
MRHLIVGDRGGTNVGECFERAAIAAGHSVQFAEVREAHRAPLWIRRINWHLRGHRPTRLNQFCAGLVEMSRDYKPDILLATGVAPITRETLEIIRSHGAKTINYLTDDPWNPSQKSKWFLKALGGYDWVFSPRRANLADLTAQGCREARYLPFAYDPRLHFPEAPQTGEESQKYVADIVFIGGADKDRVPYAEALSRAGFAVAFYGGYWDRYPATRTMWRGYAEVRTLRLATSGAKISLCLVRRANRDGHTMRSFEAAAMGGCLLVEDTPEHREIFGEDGYAVVFFNSMSKMVDSAKWLLSHESERQRLARRVHALIVGGKNTYAERLKWILKASETLHSND